MHYALVHLHPFAESVEVRDLTAGKRVFICRAKGFKGKIGLSRVAYFSSRKGVPLFKDHEYEFVSRYNNTSGVNQDSMVGIVMFLLDKEFRKPIQSALNRPS